MDDTDNISREEMIRLLNQDLAREFQDVTEAANADPSAGEQQHLRD